MISDLKCHEGWLSFCLISQREGKNSTFRTVVLTLLMLLTGERLLSSDRVETVTQSALVSHHHIRLDDTAHWAILHITHCTRYNTQNCTTLHLDTPEKMLHEIKYSRKHCTDSTYKTLHRYYLYETLHRRQTKNTTCKDIAVFWYKKVACPRLSMLLNARIAGGNWCQIFPQSISPSLVVLWYTKKIESLFDRYSRK